MVFTLLKPACHPTSLKLVEERLQYLGQISNCFGDIAAKLGLQKSLVLLISVSFNFCTQDASTETAIGNAIFIGGSMGLSLFTFVHRAPEKAKRYSVNWYVTVV